MSKKDPLAYVKTDADILLFVPRVLGSAGGNVDHDPFWRRSEELLLSASVALLRDQCPGEYSLAGLSDFLSLDEREIDKRFSECDYLFPVSEYRRFKESSAPVTRMTVVLSCKQYVDAFREEVA